MGFLETLDGISGSPITKAGFWAWDVYKKKKTQLLREVIRCEIRQGDFSRVDVDDMVGISYRLQKDVMEGVAKNNLRLLCALIAGLNESEKLTATNFLKFAPILESLTEDEIRVIAIDLYDQYNPRPQSPRAAALSMEATKELMESELYKQYKQQETDWEQTKNNFITSLGFEPRNKHHSYYTSIEDNDKMTEVHYGLLRTGLYRMSVETEYQEEEYDKEGKHGPYTKTYAEFEFTGLMVELMPYVKTTLKNLFDEQAIK